MSGFIIEYQDKNDGCVLLEGQRVTYWQGVGEATFEGKLDAFAVAYPTVVAEMVSHGVLKEA